MTLKCSICLGFVVSFLLPVCAFAGPGYWTQESAHLLPGGRGELMLIGPSRYAFRERVELGVGLFAFAALPNAQLKWALPDQPERGGRQWSVAVRHRVLLPGLIYQLTTAEAPLGASSWLDVVAFDTDMMMTRLVPDGLWSVHVGGVLALYGASSGAPPYLQEGSPLLLWHRAPLGAAARSGWGVRGGVSRRQYMGRDGWFVQGEGALHLFPSLRQVGLELDARVGLERRHLFLAFGARTASDGARFETLPVVEFGVAFE